MPEERFDPQVEKSVGRSFVGDHLEKTLAVIRGKENGL
jgi:hypothetical protein